MVCSSVIKPIDDTIIWYSPGSTLAKLNFPNLLVVVMCWVLFNQTCAPTMVSELLLILTFPLIVVAKETWQTSRKRKNDDNVLFRFILNRVCVEQIYL